MASTHQANTIFFVIIQFNNIIVEYNSIILLLRNQGHHHAKIWKKLQLTVSWLFCCLKRRQERLAGSQSSPVQMRHQHLLLYHCCWHWPQSQLVRCLFHVVVNIEWDVLQHRENTWHGWYLQHANFSSEDILKSPEASVFCKLFATAPKLWLNASTMFPTPNLCLKTKNHNSCFYLTSTRQTTFKLLFADWSVKLVDWLQQLFTLFHYF